MFSSLGQWLRAPARRLLSARKAAVPPPQFLFLDINQRCNLRCQHCAYWTLDDREKSNYLPGNRRQEILREFAGLNPRGAVVICGGESMLDLEDYFAVTRECRACGLRCLSVVNGTRIRDQALAERMIREGPSEVSVSLNSHRAERHDETRGVKQSFALAVNAIRLLLEARERLAAASSRVYVMGLIREDNYRELEAFYDFVLNDLGADKLKLNFLQPTFGRPAEDTFFAQHYIRDPQELLTVLRTCDAKYRLHLNPAWLRVVRLYYDALSPDRAMLGWHNREATPEPICNSYERNIMVDLFGNARLCFSEVFPHHPLQRPGDLHQFWYQVAGPIRRRMKDCRRPCGISHSVRREPATLKQNGA